MFVGSCNFTAPENFKCFRQHKGYVDVKVSHVLIVFIIPREISYSSKNISHKCIFKNFLCINLRLEF